MMSQRSPGPTFRQQAGVLKRPRASALSWALWCAGIGVPVAMLTAATPGYAQSVTGARAYAIPAAALGTVLSEFASQAGITLSFDADQTRGKQSAGLRGSYSVEQGLSALLVGSGLEPVHRGGGNYVLRTAPVGQGVAQLDNILVTGAVPTETAVGPINGIVATRSAAATKSDTPLIETPQSISVVTRDQMDAQNVQSVPQALRYTPGVYAEQRGVNTDALEYIYSRGFQIDQYWNGLRLPRSGFTISSMDPYLFERIELLHGPASVLYGQSSPGGLLNLVSKRPTEDPYHEVMVQTGSYGRAQTGFDVSGPVDADKKVLYRVTATALDTGTQTDHVRQQRIAIAPTLTIRPDADTSLTLFANYQRDPKGGTYNYVPAAGTVLPGKYSISRSFFAGDTNADKYQKTLASLGYEFERRLNDSWTFKQNARYLQNKVHIRGLDSTYGLTSDGEGIERESYRHDATFNSFTVDNQVQGKFATGALTHQLTVGLDYQQSRNEHLFVGEDVLSTPAISLSNPKYGIAIPEPDYVYGSSSRDHIKQLGVYVQDQIRWGKWALLAGGRRDWLDSKTTSLATFADTYQKDHAFTWRTGLVYLFDSGFAPYASYSTSFEPVSGLDGSGVAFKPTRGKQAEVGLKYQPAGQNSFMTVSVFDLKQENVLTTDPLNTRNRVQTGEIRSQGVELEAHVDVTRNLQAVASYTLTDLSNTKSNTVQDKSPIGIPRQMASFWLNYSLPGVLAGMQTSAGVRYVGSTYGDAANTFKVPAVTLVDLSLRYDLGRVAQQFRGMTVGVTASNLFDKSYIAACLNVNACAFGVGRLVLANLKYQW